MNHQQPRPGQDPAFKISNAELTDEQLRDVERRLDQMLDVAWSVYQTIGTDPKRLAALRRYLTDFRKESTIRRKVGGEEVSI